MHAQQLLFVLAAAGVALIEARTIGNKPRADLGSAQCNVARLRIVNALGQAKDSAANIADVSTKDATNAGLQQANDGIRTIAQALVSGGAPPADARDQVEAGIKAADAALQGGDQSDQAVTESAASLQKAAQAGADVVAQCK